jgi:peptide/nickel transport system substrate-binding protein
MEKIVNDDWTLDPITFNYKINFRPNQYEAGILAESWEFTNPTTFVIHLRKGILWQNIPPVNGRELTADDIVFHYDRQFGLGDGFTQPSPYQATVAAWKSLLSVTATDKYTVAFKWNVPNPEFITETQQGDGTFNDIEAPEAVKLWGDLNDWHHAIGTGPFILTDFVSGSSATLVKNNNYWWHDERYPQNKIPYLDSIKMLIIPDQNTALAALRTGKIDIIDTASIQDAQAMQKTNPEILKETVIPSHAFTIDPRNDVMPFKDIRVRKAMQMAIDLPTIAKTYYLGAASPDPCTLTSVLMTGWGFPYSQWPQALKDEYAYNPTAAKQLLAAAGYPNGFKTDIVADNSGDMDILQICKSYFTAVGIDMDIRGMDPTSWVNFVQIGHKNDALSMRSSAGQLSNGYEYLRQLNRFQTGYSVNWVMVSDPVYDAFYPKALAATNIDDIKQVLKDANEYVAVQHFCISLLVAPLYSLYQPWLKGYAAPLTGVGAETGAIQHLGFYGARYWIDQKLKKSLP